MPQLETASDQGQSVRVRGQEGPGGPASAPKLPAAAPGPSGALTMKLTVKIPSEKDS